jgi:hypothetical protein
MASMNNLGEKYADPEWSVREIEAHYLEWSGLTLPTWRVPGQGGEGEDWHVMSSPVVAEAIDLNGAVQPLTVDGTIAKDLGPVRNYL